MPSYKYIYLKSNITSFILKCKIRVIKDFEIFGVNTRITWEGLFSENNGGVDFFN
jgi:hypothetical protein